MHTHLNNNLAYYFLLSLSVHVLWSDYVENQTAFQTVYFVFFKTL